MCLFLNQPPSGGCVLKRSVHCTVIGQRASAAFGRLCVETQAETDKELARDQPPSGGCVLKPLASNPLAFYWPSAAFGRLCVET